LIPLDAAAAPLRAQYFATRRDIYADADNIAPPLRYAITPSRYVDARHIARARQPLLSTCSVIFIAHAQSFRLSPIICHINISRPRCAAR